MKVLVCCTVLGASLALASSVRASPILPGSMAQRSPQLTDLRDNYAVDSNSPLFDLTPASEVPVQKFYSSLRDPVIRVLDLPVPAWHYPGRKGDPLPERYNDPRPTPATPAPVPEPSTWVLMAMAAAGLVLGKKLIT